MSQNNEPVAATFLIGTTTSPPEFGQEADLYADAMEAEITHGIEHLTRDNTEVFPTSIVARELKPGSVGMTVIKVRDPDYTMSDAEDDLDSIKQLFTSVGYKVNNTYLEQGDYFG